MAPKNRAPAASDSEAKTAKKRKTEPATEAVPDTPFRDMVAHELERVPVPTPHGRALVDAQAGITEDGGLFAESPKDRAEDLSTAVVAPEEHAEEVLAAEEAPAAEAPKEHAEEAPAAEAPKEHAEEAPAAEAPEEHAEEAPAATKPAGPRVKLGDVGQSDALMKSLDSVLDLCCKCGREVDHAKCRVKCKSSGDVRSVTCNDCNCIMTMSQRKISASSDVALSKLNAEDSKSFFRRACDTKGLSDRFDWDKIRGCIIETMTDSVLTRKSVQWSDKYLPLSVWERKGFDHKRIEAAGKCFEDKVLGWVYAAPLCVVSREATREHCEQTVRQAERKFVAAAEDEEAKAELGGYATDHLAATASGQPPAPKNETPAKLKARLEREAAQRARAAEQEALKKAKAAKSLNDKCGTLAQKVVLALGPIAVSLEKSRKSAEFDNFPVILQERFDQQEPKIKEVLAESKEFTKKVTKANKKGEALTPLSITNEQLKTMVSDSRALLSHADQISKMFAGAN